MPINYIGSEEFRQTLNDWFDKQHQRQAEHLNSNKLLIPQRLRNYQKTLYRSAVVDDNFINKANLARARFDDYTLWTKEQSIARSMLRMQTIHQGEYKILVAKAIAPRDLVLDLDEFITFVGIPQLAMFGFSEQHLRQFKEQRAVLATNMLSISRSEYTILEQYNNESTI